MATQWDEFEAVQEPQHDTDWSNFEPVTVDPEALRRGIAASVQIPSTVRRVLEAGAEGSEMGRGEILGEQLAQQAKIPTTPLERAARSFQLGGMATAPVNVGEGEPFTLLPIPKLPSPMGGFGTSDLAQVLGIKPTAQNRATLAMLGAPETEPAVGATTAGLNLAGQFGRFAGTPEGIGAGLLAATGPVGAGAVGTYYGIRSAMDVPALAREAGRLSVEGTPQEQRESLLNLAAAIGVPAAVVTGMFASGQPATAIYNFLNRKTKPATIIPERPSLPAEPIDIAATVTPYAPEKRLIEEGRIPEYPRTETLRLPPAPGGGDRVVGETPVQAQAPDVTQGPAPPATAPPVAVTTPTATEAPPVPSVEDVHKGTPPLPETLKGQTPNQRIRIQLADGTVIPALWNGYFEFPGTPYDGMPSLATEREGNWSHGFSLPEGATILDPIPTFEEWKQGKTEPAPERITAAAYTTPEGKIETGANHPEILQRLGIPGFETAESRNTPQFGFMTDKGRFITREQAGPVAEASGQNLKDFEPGEPVHSNEVESPTEPGQPLSETKADLPSTLKAADDITALLNQAGYVLTKQVAHDIMAKHHGGTMAEGKFTAKDQSDVIELAVNRYINQNADGFNPTEANAGRAKQIVQVLKMLMERLPTQTTRTGETDAMQQFSTPPTEAFAANWVANIQPGETMLEPSAGIGGLAVFAKNAGANVIANELSPRRAELLKQLGITDQVTQHNAEQLHAILTPAIKSGAMKQPTVVVMNPPFSRAALTDRRSTEVGANHVEQALKLLPPGGRLVAIVGEGMAADKPAFAAWWSRISKLYNVRANIGVSGEEYRKYGTTFGNQMLVIDKTGPTPQGGTVVGSVDKVEDLIPLLEKVRNDRPTAQPTPAQPGGVPTTQTGTPAVQPQGNAPAPTGGPGVGGPGRPTSGGLRPTPQGGPGLGVVPPTTTVSTPGVTGPGGPAVTPAQTPGGVGGPPGGVPPAAPGSVPTTTVETKPTVERPLGEGIFSNYVPAKVHVPGTVKHPAPLVESTAMASVEPVDPTYKPSLTDQAIAFLSDEQMENVIYAGQAHENFLPTDERQGYFIGDGTGVGKGAQNAAIFLDNWNKGRTKGLWVSAKPDLIKDGQRDFTSLGMDPKTLIDFGKSGGKLLTKNKEGIGFVSYTSLATNFEGIHPNTPVGEAATLSPSTRPEKPSRIKLFHDWVGGKNFDGVIIFDESHFAGNAVDMRGTRGMERASERGKMVVALQALFPKARIVYSSATGATDVTNLSYADRLGIWGPGTPFPNKMAFFNAISGSGLSAMEIVARDLKATGKYLARTLSFEGIQQDQLPHILTPQQVEIYDEVSRAWQLTLRSINDSMANTGMANNGSSRGQTTGKFWGAAQRFYNQLLTAMQTPTIIAKIKDSLAKGNAAVVQLVNTNEATLNRELAKRGAEADEGDTDWLEDLDLSPKDILIDYVDQHYPTQLFAPVTDDQGNTRWQPQWNADGTPIESPEAVEAKEQLMTKLKLLRAPSNPIEMILDTFGEENVAEITGRTKRVVNQLQPDGTRKRVQQVRSNAHRQVEAKEFNDDKRLVLLFSEAGGTGFSYHASRTFKNQRQRDHIGAQMGWRADAAIQGMGRTNRTNQAFPPHYYLPSTDIPGHKRFISTIMRRLSELGALTGGERKSAAREMFKESDDLETPYALQAVHRFFVQLFSQDYPDLSFSDISRKMGFTTTSVDPATGEPVEINTLVDRDTGTLKMGALPPVHKFLNRVLILEKAEQEKVFRAFDRLREDLIDNAKADGSYDPGTQTLRALAIRKVADEVVYSDPNSTAKTRLVTIEHDQPVKVIPWDKRNDVAADRPIVQYVRNIKSGRVFALKEGPDRTLENGTVVQTWRRVSPTGYDILPRNSITTEDYYGHPKNYEEMQPQQAQTLWEDQEAKAPKIKTHKDTYVVGTFLPIWDRLRLARPRIWRMTTDKGENLLGAHVPETAVADLRDRLGAGSEQMTPQSLFNRVMDTGTAVELANGWTIKRSRVQGDYRIEVKGVEYNQINEFEKFLGGYMERIAFEPRFFIPTDEDTAVRVIQRILKKSPVVNRRPGAGGTPPGAVGYFPRMSEALGLGEQAGPPTLEQIQQSRIADAQGQAVSLIDPNNIIKPLVFYSGLPFPISLDAFRDMTDSAKLMGNASHEFWKRFAGNQAPRITAADQASGEAAVRYSASTYMAAREKGLLFAMKVLEGIMEKGFDVRLGTGISEDNLRWLKQRNLDLVNEVENRQELIAQAREEVENYKEDARAGDSTAKAIIRELRQRIARLSEYTDEDADRFQKLADNTFTFIGKPGSVFPTEEAYKAFMGSKPAQTAINRHRQLWRQIKDPIYRMAADLDPDTPLESRGLEYGARINLKGIYEAADQSKTMVGKAPRSTLTKQTATLKRRSPFTRRAEGQAPAYEASYTELMGHGFQREYPVALQHEFLRKMIDAGIAQLSSQESPPGLLVHGEPTKGYLLRLRPWNGRYLQVPKSLAGEYEEITGLTPARRLPVFTKIGEYFTKASITGLAEGSTHVSNLLMEMFTGAGPTSNPLFNVLLKSLGRADLLYRFPRVLIRAFENNREEMLSMMERGMTKEPYRGLLGFFLNYVDRGSRLVSHDIYRGMAENGWVEDSETGLREFVNQMGNYNKKLQPFILRFLRDSQVQPFATAVHTFNIMGVRRMFMQSGAKPAGHFARLALMADIAAGWLGFLVAIGVINYLVSGNSEGPKGTKIGDIGWIGDDGKLHTFPAGAMTGFMRGPRITGLQAYVESRRLGLTPEQSVNSSVKAVENTGLTYFTGPLARFITVGTSGYRPGAPMVREAKPVPPTAEFDPLKSQLAENIVTGLRTSTPLADAVAGFSEGKPISEIAQRQFSRFSPRAGLSEETIASLPKIVKQAEINDYADALSKEARKLPINQRWQFVYQRMQKDQLTPDVRNAALIEMRKKGTFRFK